MVAKGGKIVLNQAVLVGRIVRDPELKDTEKGKVTWYVFALVIIIVLFCTCVLSLVGGTYNPFIYFRF